MQLRRSQEKRVIPEARGIFPNHTSCSSKEYYLPLQTLSGFSFPSWMKIRKCSMINFPILYFPSLSAFSWPLAFLSGCRTWTAGLDKSLWTQPGLEPAKLSQKFSNYIGMWFLLVQWTEALGKDPRGSWGCFWPPHLTFWVFSKLWRLKQTPPDLSSWAVPGCTACTRNGWKHT